MEYESEFAKSFMIRTLSIVQNYDGEYDATLLINCLLGLLVLPKETLLNKIRETSQDSLDHWGIGKASIIKAGKCDHGHTHELNAWQLIRRLRNAVAHFKVTPFPSKGNVKGFEFKDRNQFHAKLTLLEIKDFVICLSKHLNKEA